MTNAQGNGSNRRSISALADDALVDGVQEITELEPFYRGLIGLSCAVPS